MMNRRRFLAGGVSVLAAPLAAEAQPVSRRPHVAWFFFTPSLPGNRNLDAFREQLHQLGYTEGQNIVLEIHSAEGNPERLPMVATAIVQARPDVIGVSSPQALVATRQATATIPIVFTAIINPVGAGFVNSLARPGGNVTGVSWDAAPELAGKQMALLRDLAPRASRMALLWNPDTAGSTAFVNSAQSAAHAMGLPVRSVPARSPEEISAAFRTMAKERAAGVVVLASAFTYNHREQIARLAAQEHLPAIYGNRDSVVAGGLAAYGPSLVDQFRRAAFYVDKILKGAKPADLPVEQPTKFDFVINLKTAKALGLTIPPAVLARADEVIQ